jgi:hypothetical protein
MKVIIQSLVLILIIACSAQASFVKQPYLQNLTDTSIVVRWEISSSQTGLVQYGLTTNYGSEVNDPNSNSSHELTLPGLIFDTVYHYCVISGVDSSLDASFHTRIIQSKPFRFIAYGDNRSDSVAHQNVVNQMQLVSPLPGLIVNVGDLTNNGSSADYRIFFNVERNMINRVTLFPVLGNHDISNMTNWFSCFVLPNNEQWYSTRYGNSAFICLDDNSSFSPGSAQYNWLLSELQADSADPSVRHIFIINHQPPYTTNTDHSSNMTIRQYLCPLFERFHVSIVFNGHNHCYEHSLVNGVHYIITGGGGAPLYNSWGPVQPWTIYREATFEFVLVDVRADTIYCRGIKPGGMVIDSFAIIGVHPGIAEADTGKINSALVFEATPNPFTDKVHFHFMLHKSSLATLSIYDASGKKVASLLNSLMSKGSHDVLWNRSTLPDGFYVAVLKAGEITNTLRLSAVH